MLLEHLTGHPVPRVCFSVSRVFGSGATFVCIVARGFIQFGVSFSLIALHLSLCLVQSASRCHGAIWFLGFCCFTKRVCVVGDHAGFYCCFLAVFGLVGL